MATTKISTEKTAQEIAAILSKTNLVKYIQFEYEEDFVCTISFIIMEGEKRLPFKIPIRWEPVLLAMENDRKVTRSLCTEEQAKRVAWRQWLRAIQALLAIIGIRQVDIKEFFMSFLVMKDGTTLYDSLVNNQFLIEYKIK
jgi:hypothetical protein